MKKSIFRSFIGFLGIFFIFLSFIIKREHFDFHPEVILYLLISIFCAHSSITFGNTIVSFEILMNYFIYLSFGYHYASIFAFLTILSAWLLKYHQNIFNFDQNSKKILNTAFFNAGMYASFYSITGILTESLPSEILIRFLSIVLFIIINNFILILDFLFDGLKETKDYLEKWFLKTLIIESLTYSLAVPIYIIYKTNGFIITFPLFIALSLFSFIGNRMSNYQEKLLENLTKMKKLNESLRKISEIMEIDRLIREIALEGKKLFECKEIFLNVKIGNLGNYYLDENENFSKINGRHFEISKFKLIYQSSSIDIYLFKERFEKENDVIFSSFGKQCEIALTNAYLHNVSIHDTLTNLFTRRFFENRLEEELTRSKREKTIFSVVLIDINNFKNINDNYGHIEGDKVLIKFSNYLRENLRKSDIIARWGGDEFIILLPNITALKTQKIFERLRKKILKIKFEINNKKQKIDFTYSTFTYNLDMDLKSSEIFRIIDKKLLEFKKYGKRC